MRVCASGEEVLCTPSVTFGELRLTGRENATKKINHGGQISWFLSITIAEWFF